MSLQSLKEAEHPLNTVSRYSDSWDRDIKSNRLVADLVSVSKETNQRPDTYHFVVKEGKLIDPESGKDILGFVLPGVERKVVVELEGWANKNDEGLAFWVSPDLSGRYPRSKVIFHRIAYTLEGEKVLRNSVVLFDAEFKNPELLRQTLFIQEDTEENIFGVIDWIGKHAIKEASFEAFDDSTREKAEYYVGLLERGVPKFEVIAKMKAEGFIGNSPLSCPIFGLLIEARYCEKCPICHTKIQMFICKGYKCKGCGKVKEC